MIQSLTGPPQLSVHSMQRELETNNKLSERANVLLQLFQMARDGNREAFDALEKHASATQCKFACGYVAVLLTSDKVAIIGQDITRANELMQVIVQWLMEQANTNVETFRHVQFLLVRKE